MFGITERSRLNAAVVGAAAIVAVSVIAPGTAFAIAQRPPLPENTGACASGRTWQAVMPDNVIVTMPCSGAAGQQSFVGHTAAISQARAPLSTGSIRTAEAGPSNRMMMVASQKDCRPGAYWMMNSTDSDTSTPIACR